MKKKRIVHFFENTIFTRGFIEMAREIEIPADQYFVTWGGMSTELFPILEGDRILYSQNSYFFVAKMLWWLLRADTVVIHGLFNKKLLILWLTKFMNCHVLWVVWGGDLVRRPRDGSLKKYLANVFQKMSVGRVDRIAVLQDSDRIKFLQLSGKSDIPVFQMGYRNPISLEKVEHFLNGFEGGRAKGLTRILIGNSASLSNQHVFVFEKLAHLSGPDVQFVVPLGYGDSRYKDVVLKKGEELFGSSFQPIVRHLPIDEYIQILAGIDVAIFYMTRQQALSNIYGLAAMGKKIYLHPQSGMLESFKNADHIDFWNFDDFLSGPRTLLELKNADESRIENNQLRAKQALDDGIVREVWRKNLLVLATEL